MPYLLRPLPDGSRLGGIASPLAQLSENSHPQLSQPLTSIHLVFSRCTSTLYAQGTYYSRSSPASHCIIIVSVNDYTPLQSTTLEQFTLPKSGTAIKPDTDHTHIVVSTPPLPRRAPQLTSTPRFNTETGNIGPPASTCCVRYGAETTGTLTRKVREKKRDRRTFHPSLQTSRMRPDGDVVPNAKSRIPAAGATEAQGGRSSFRSAPLETQEPTRKLQGPPSRHISHP